MTSDANTHPDSQDDSIPDRFLVDFSGLTLLGTYRVERKLADGGMGSVYLGEDTNLGRPVVVKVPHVRFLGEPGFRKRFAREISELVRLEHPYIVRILAQGTHEDVPFFVLQFLGGESLEARLEADKRIDPQTALPWFLRIAETLDFVHARKTVHRDVKPANILFDESGHVFLSDFGVAKALDNEDANVTEAGTGIGSPRYMSPEQGYGRQLEPSADQYALAATLYETLSAATPHGEGTAVELLVRKASKEPTPLIDVAPEVPQAASDAIAKGLAREPADRHANCVALIQAVQHAYGIGTSEFRVPQDAPVSEPAPPAQAMLAGRPVLFWVALGIMATSVIGVVLATRGDKRPVVLTQRAPMAPLEQTVRLLDRGAQPHALRQYTFDGEPRTFHVRVQRTETATSGAKTQPPRAMSLGLVYAVTAMSNAEGATVNWVLQDITIPSVDGAPDVPGTPSSDARKKGESKLKASIGSSGNMRVSLSGARHVAPDIVGETPMQRNIRTSIDQFARELLIPFPNEPIGIGARWEVTEAFEAAGGRFLQTARYSLKTIEAGNYEIEGSISLVAPDQEMPSMGGIRQRLLSLEGGGSVSGRLRLDRAVPFQQLRVFEVTLRIEQDHGEGTDPQPWDNHLEAKTWVGDSAEAIR